MLVKSTISFFLWHFVIFHSKSKKLTKLKKLLTEKPVQGFNRNFVCLQTKRLLLTIQNLNKNGVSL